MEDLKTDKGSEQRNEAALCRNGISSVKIILKSINQVLQVMKSLNS